MSRKKPGIPMRITGPVLLALRMAGAHHLYENENDDEVRWWLDRLPRPDWEEAARSYTGVGSKTIRIPAAKVDSFIRFLKIAATNPHQGPGVGGAIESRIEKLESMSSIERLGAIEP